MKTKTRLIKTSLVAGLSATVVTVAVIAANGRAPNGYSAHEWGTFTSVQGCDGVLLDWRPLESSVLPKFVYDWSKPGLDRQVFSPDLFSKRAMITLQRMETPVIYFYGDTRQTVDVSVKFPQGKITEWYPQAQQIGPALAQKPEFSKAVMSESGAHWANVEILPADEHVSLPTDKSGSHYFAARDTDSACLSVPSPMPAKSAAEQEKFIFYRGAGSFSTPLTVTMNSANSVTITNTGSEPLAELFVLDLQNRAGRYIHLDRLAPGEKRTVLLDSPKPSVAMDVLSSQIEKEMAKALAGQGLYEREATAMVNTWKDSWFAEDGLRVLYILPRQWTDRTLPLTLKPAPRELVRVMVGRAEVLTPSLQQNLSVALIKTHQGDTAARAHVIAELKALGRFAEPALRLATAKLDKATVQGAWTLYNTTFVSATTKVATASPFE